MAAEWLIATLRRIWQLLQEADAPAAVMGGMAMSVWQYARSTRDVDLLLGAKVSQADALLQRLEAAGFRPKNAPPLVSLGELHLLQLLYEPSESFLDIQVDLLFADSAYQRRALERRIFVTLPDADLQIAVLTCEDLILHKLLAGRLIDAADVAALISLNRDSLDRNYLAHWLDALDLKVDFAAIWRKTFPDRPF
jgi:hypothetical protein